MIIYIQALAVSYALIYALAAFTAWSFNPSEWCWFLRLIVSIAALVFMLAAARAYMEEEAAK